MAPRSKKALLAHLESLLEAEEPRLIRWLQREWRTQTADVSDAELLSIARTGDLSSELLEGFEQRYARFIVDRLAPAWRTAGAAGIDALPFDLLAPSAIDDYVTKRSGERIVALTQVQRDAFREVLRQHTVVEPLSERSLTAVLRPLIGLTPRQAKHIEVLRADLAAKGTTGVKLESALLKRSLRYRANRAKLIARTELAAAYNGAGLAAVQDLDPSIGQKKRWWAQADERRCPICSRLHDEVVHVSEPFSNGSMHPPAHPGCRCVLLYERVAMPDPVELDGTLEKRAPIAGSHELSEAEVWDVIRDERALIDAHLGVGELPGEIRAQIPSVWRDASLSSAEQIARSEALYKRLDVASARLDRTRQFLKDLLGLANEPEHLTGVGLGRATMRNGAPLPVDLEGVGPEVSRASKAFGRTLDPNAAEMALINDGSNRAFYAERVKSRLIDVADLEANLSQLRFLDYGEEGAKEISAEVAKVAGNLIKRRLKEAGPQIERHDPVFGQVFDRYRRMRVSDLTLPALSNQFEIPVREFRKITKKVLAYKDPDAPKLEAGFDIIDFAIRYQDPATGKPPMKFSRNERRDLTALINTWTPLLGPRVPTINVNTDGRLPKSTVWHEFGHHVQEQNKRVLDAEARFLQKRWQENGGQEKRLKDIQSNVAYRDAEVAIEGGFWSAYVGKVYGSRTSPTASEVLPMGIQEFLNEVDALNLYAKDPDHFALVVATLRGRWGKRK